MMAEPMLSIVIPALDAAHVLPGTLQSLAEGRGNAGSEEVIVADGGSVDETRAIAAAAGAGVITAPRGRGSQLAAGAAAASGRWLLFLHADTRLPLDWCAVAHAFVAETDNIERAGYFRFALDDPSPGARRIEATVRLRNRLLGLPYGDQGLLLDRRFYDSLGGFRPMPLMEDVDMVRRIGRRRLVMLDAAATTSAERYRRDGFVLRPLRNTLCLGLYALGAPPRLIHAIYR